MTDYTALYKQMHEDPLVFGGDTTKSYVKEISQLITKFNASSILDYGCGKGLQYTRDNLHHDYFNSIMPALFDIGVSEFEQLPSGTFDAVISIDVLEHIPELQLEHVLKQIYSKANKCVFLGIHSYTATKYLPNGENVHCTIRPVEWWIKLVSQYATVYTVIMVNSHDKQWVIENEQFRR